MRCKAGRWEDTMGWTIESRNEATGRTGESREYSNEAGFLTALNDLFMDPKRQFVSATLPDGTVIDELAARRLAGGFTIEESGLGEAGLG
jgi:hypothetical protein